MYTRASPAQSTKAQPEIQKKRSPSPGRTTFQAAKQGPSLAQMTSPTRPGPGFSGLAVHARVYMGPTLEAVLPLYTGGALIALSQPHVSFPRTHPLTPSISPTSIFLLDLVRGWLSPSLDGRHGCASSNSSCPTSDAAVRVHSVLSLMRATSPRLPIVTQLRIIN